MLWKSPAGVEQVLSQGFLNETPRVPYSLQVLFEENQVLPSILANSYAFILTPHIHNGSNTELEIFPFTFEIVLDFLAVVFVFILGQCEFLW